MIKGKSLRLLFFTMFLLPDLKTILFWIVYKMPTACVSCGQVINALRLTQIPGDIWLNIHLMSRLNIWHL